MPLDCEIALNIDPTRKVQQCVDFVTKDGDFTLLHPRPLGRSPPPLPAACAGPAPRRGGQSGGRVPQPRQADLFDQGSVSDEGVATPCAMSSTLGRTAPDP